MANNDTLISQLQSMGLSDEEKQAIADAYQGQFNPQGNAEASLPWSPASRDLSTLKNQQPQTSTPSVPEGFMGPPSPSVQDLQSRRTEAKPVNTMASSPTEGSEIGGSRSASLLTRIPVDMGKFNPLGNVPKGNDTASISDILSKLSGQVSPELKTAQDNRDRMQLLSMLGKSANQILGGQTHTTPSNAVYDEMSKNAGQGITDIQNKNNVISEGLKQQDMASKIADQQAKDDPNSSISLAYRAAAEKMAHGKLPDNISASQLEKISPVFEKMYAAEQASLDRSARLKESDNLRQTAIDSRIENQANTRFDKNIKPFFDRLEGAKRAEGLIDSISKGQLIASKNIRTQLSNEITQLLVGSTTTAMHDREKAEINTAYSNMKDALNYLQSAPSDTIPPAYLKQIATEVKIIKKKYLDAAKRKTKELDSGTQYEIGKNVFNNRFNSQLEDQGLDPDTLENAQNNEHPQDDAAIKWAKQNPNDPRAATILKVNGM